MKGQTMTKEDWVKIYTGIIHIEMHKAVDLKNKDLEHHCKRCFAFYLVEAISQMSRKEMAGYILYGGFPTIQTMDDLREYLEEEYDCYSEDELEEMQQTVHDHVKSYFGNR